MQNYQDSQSFILCPGRKTG